MKTATIPTGTPHPLDPDRVTLVTIQHDYYSGQRWRVLAIYEDNHDTKNRRVLSVRIPTTPKGNVKRTAEIEATVSYCAGYDTERNQWGADDYRNAYHAVTTAEATQLLRYADQAAQSDRFKGAQTNSHVSAHYYRRP